MLSHRQNTFFPFRGGWAFIAPPPNITNMLIFSILHTCLLLSLLSSGSSQTISYGCKPRNRDLRPDSSLNIGILHRPANCNSHEKGKTAIGKRLKVHFEARLFRDCRKIDSSRDRGEEYEFTLGDGTTIKGWERGLLGMCEGERRKLIVPSGLAYGESGAGNGEIPPGATIIYDVELLSNN